MIVYIKTLTEKPKECRDCPCYMNSRRCPILWRETNPYEVPEDCPLGELDLSNNKFRKD